MARHRKHRDPISYLDSSPKFHNKTRRDDYSIATDFSEAIFEPPRSVPLLNRIELDSSFIDRFDTPLDVEDRRQYHPGRQNRGYASAGTSKINIKPIKASLFSPEIKYAFKPVGLAMVCVRRHMRKEVLHALRKTGKGSRFNKKPRRSDTSSIRC